MRISEINEVKYNEIRAIRDTGLMSNMEEAELQGSGYDGDDDTSDNGR